MKILMQPQWSSVIKGLALITRCVFSFFVVYFIAMFLIPFISAFVAGVHGITYNSPTVDMVILLLVPTGIFSIFFIIFGFYTIKSINMGIKNGVDKIMKKEVK